MKSLFVVNVRLPSEYKAWVGEMTKTIVLLVSIHVLQHLSRNVGGQNARGLFNVHFWKLLIFALIGFSAYHLVVQKVVRFRYIDEWDAPNDGQSLHSLSMSPFNLISRLRSWLKSKL